MNENDEVVWSYAHGLWGTSPPLAEEISMARIIMDEAPSKVSPLEIARYFLRLRVRNADGEPYIAEWAKRSNPLIVGFFSATTYGDATDQTKWCAAFVNWCLRRAGREFTKSASSGSFRCFGQHSEAPVAGDIAVFKNAGENKECSGSGHVGFWIRQDEKHVTVLGGNQGGTRISEKAYATSSAHGNPSLMTVRTIPV